MKINELRNGNIVLFEPKYAAEKAGERHWFYGMPHTWCSPVELSEEWFVKMGFEKVPYEDGGHYYCKDIPGLHPLSFLSSGDDFTSVSLFDYEKECKYVHEVQNIYFALTGEEIL